MGPGKVASSNFSGFFFDIIVRWVSKQIFSLLHHLFLQLALMSFVQDQASKAKMAPALSSNNTGFCKDSSSDSIPSPPLEQACCVQVQGTPNG